jgi:hypothetical protein
MNKRITRDRVFSKKQNDRKANALKLSFANVGIQR